MTLNYLESPTQLKVCFAYGTVDVRRPVSFGVSAMRDWMSMAFTDRDKIEANELWFQSIGGLYEFSPGFTAEVATNQSWAGKLGYYSHYAASSLRYLEMCGRLEYVLLWKLMIQKQMTLTVYKCLKASSASYVTRFVRCHLYWRSLHESSYVGWQWRHVDDEPFVQTGTGSSSRWSPAGRDRRRLINLGVQSPPFDIFVGGHFRHGDCCTENADF